MLPEKELRLQAKRPRPRDCLLVRHVRVEQQRTQLLENPGLHGTGKPLLHVAAHGGNECGAFKHMFPDMDIVTTGAIYAKHHTPEEYLDLESFDRSIRFLKTFLTAL